MSHPVGPWTDTFVGAACAGVGDPDLFFSPNPVDRRSAKRLCKGCPVSTACLNWALENREQGVWGGTDEVDRMMLRPDIYLSAADTAEPVLPLFQAFAGGTSV